jgi:solute carrier family 25 citrate transporter 1
MPDSSKRTLPVVSLLAGGVAGGVEAFATYPFEFAKTRVQLRQHASTAKITSKNPFVVIAQIYKQEGLRTMYKGCIPLMVGSVGKDAVRFLSFDTVKNAFKDPETGNLTPVRNMLAGMTAGVAGVCIQYIRC